MDKRKRSTENILFGLLGIHDGESHREGVVRELTSVDRWDGMGCRASTVGLWIQERSRMPPVLGVSGEIGARLGGGRRTLGSSSFSRTGFNKFSSTL